MKNAVDWRLLPRSESAALSSAVLLAIAVVMVMKSLLISLFSSTRKSRPCRRVTERIGRASRIEMDTGSGATCAKEEIRFCAPDHEPLS